jgi:CheY-like chemotaxis protein
MGGEISVSSEVGVGTTFSFYIQTKHVATPEMPLPVNTKITEGKKVLIIDDNTTLLKALKNELELLKLKSASASSRQEALEFINNEEPFDVVILDMQMPQMNPVNVAKTIKSIHPKLPIIPLSYVGNEEIAKYPELFRSVLTKPVKQAQLLKLVQTALRVEDGEKIAQEVSKGTNILNEDFAASYPLSILIAEDNLVNQKIALRVLSKLGYEPEIANNGQETVEMFKVKLHDVILMDMQMPVMDGIEATKMIRSCQLVKQPQIIAMTANAMAEDRERCLEEGMNDYISKPVKLEELIDILKNASLLVKLQEQL